MSALLMPIIPPFDPLDLDIALVDAAARAPLEEREISMLADPVLGEVMEYALLCAEEPA